MSKNELEVNQSTQKYTPGPAPYSGQADSEGDASNNAKQYIYQYGIKNIELSNSAYGQNGIFVTKPINVEGNIMEVSLSSIEEHPLFNEIDGMATDRLTSIEYYVSMNENPALNDWLPILPEETKIVKCEKLFFQGLSAKLRFHASISEDTQTQVYKNNILMNDDAWYFTDRGAAIQLSRVHDSSAIYTIDYVPDVRLVNPWSIAVDSSQSEILRQVETFPQGTDSNNTIRLSRYPFVNYHDINEDEGYDANTSEYRPIDVFLEDASIVDTDGAIKKEFFPQAYSQQDEYFTLNKTDYRNQQDHSLNRYSIDPEKPYKNMEYKQQKDRLIFTESFNRADMYYNEATNHGNASIKVHYDYLAMDFRLKIILRKNTGDELVVTPMVNRYQLKFKVMR